MSRQRDREEFVSIMAREAPSVPLDVVQRLMAAETTLHRIAELQCSSEAYDRDRVQCPGKAVPVNGDAGRECLCDNAGEFKDHSPDVVTCGNCNRSWCERCDPAPSAPCHWCHGRGKSKYRVKLGEIPACSHGMVPRGDVREAQLQRRLRKLVEPYGISLNFNSDPRGPAILVGVPSGYTNDWGKRGICVP